MSRFLIIPFLLISAEVEAQITSSFNTDEKGLQPIGIFFILLKVIRVTLLRSAKMAFYFHTVAKNLEPKLFDICRAEGLINRILNRLHQRLGSQIPNSFISAEPGLTFNCFKRDDKT